VKGLYEESFPSLCVFTQSLTNLFLIQENCLHFSSVFLSSILGGGSRLYVKSFERLYLEVDDWTILPPGLKLSALTKVSLQSSISLISGLSKGFFLSGSPHPTF